jgi:hypothetical protein
MALNIQVKVWIMTPCSVVTLKKEATWSSETMVTYRNTTWRYDPEDLGFKIVCFFQPVPEPLALA